MTGDIIVSSDGIRWTKPSYPAVTTIVDMAYCPTNQRFVGGINNGSLIYSDDHGATWNPHSFVPVVNLNGLYYVRDRFIGTCASGRLILSTNGTTWSHYSTASLMNLQGAAYGNNTYVVVGNNGTVVTSQDNAATWQVQPAMTTNTLNSVAYGNGLFVAAGGSTNGDVITSIDGIAWTRHADVLPIQTCYRVVFYNGVFLAVGAFGRVYSSIDGNTWTSVSVPTSSALFCATTDGPGLTVVGMDGTIMQLDPPSSAFSGGGGGGGGCFINNLLAQ